MSAPAVKPDERERDFAARTGNALAELGRAHAEATLDATFATLRPRRFGWAAVLATALAAAAVAAVLTWALRSTGGAESPVAFDGGVGRWNDRGDDRADDRGEGATLVRDAAGMPRELAVEVGGTPDGERVSFRGGRVARIEHWKAGKLDGVATDFDAGGRVTRIETWHDGVVVGPALELDPDLRPRAPGDAP